MQVSRHHSWAFAAVFGQGCFVEARDVVGTSDGSTTMDAPSSEDSSATTTNGTATTHTPATSPPSTTDNDATDASTGTTMECAAMDPCYECATCTIEENGVCEDVLVACTDAGSCLMIGDCMQMCGMPTLECYNACMRMGSTAAQSAAYDLFQCTACANCVGPCAAWAQICMLPPPGG